MKLKKEDLEVLANETIEDDVLIPLRNGFLIYTTLLVLVSLWIFWNQSLASILGISAGIILSSLGFHLLVFRYEENIVLRFRDKVLTFQRVGELVESCGVSDDEFKLAGHVGFRGEEDPAKWLEEDDERVSGQ